LKRYIRIYGYENFDLRFDKNLIEYCNLSNIDEKEEFWIKHYDTFNNGINLTKGGKYDWKRNYYKPTLQYDLKGNFIKEWDCGKEAYINLGLKNYDGISACCMGKQKTACGFIWRYKTNKKYPLKIETKIRKEYKKGVKRVKNQSIEINDKKYNSITQAALDLGWTFGKLNRKIQNNQIKYKWLK